MNPCPEIERPLPTWPGRIAGLWFTALWVSLFPGTQGLLAQDEVSEAAAATSAPFVVNDHAVRARFEEQLNAIRESEKAIDAKAIVSSLAQLDQSKTRAVLPGLEIRKETEGKSLESAALYEAAIESTLVVGNLYQCGKCTKWHSSLAGGVWIDPSGILVTNYHVIESDNAGIFGVMTRSGEVFQVVEVLASSEKDDLAVLRVEADQEFPAVRLAQKDVPIGSEVRVISHPDGRFYTFSEGIAARHYLDRNEGAARLQITADYARGSSGCGVFDETGALVGVVASTTSIYYRENGKVQENLQMVVKACIPVGGLHDLIEKSE